jgi:DNA polymerase-3 subunit gamma/tau
MEYQVLARKYRPLLFGDIIAQEHITKTLARAVETGRIAHGYLFSGPRGTGKTTTARVLAKALNCRKGPTPTPCNECEICREINAGSSMDVLEIDAASNTSVDDVRTLRENINYLPTSGRKRVFIIDEVHRLSGSAFDALLKTLEEPPEHAVFIFATTEPHRVPPTILSRTQRYDFRRVATSDLARHLSSIAQKEGIEIDSDAVFLIARKGEGSVRDALSLLDQMIALVDGKIDSEDVTKTLGIVDRQFLVDLIEIVAAGESTQVFDRVERLFSAGADIAEFVNDSIEYLRNLLVQRTAADPERLLDISSAEKDQLVKQASYFSESDLLRMIQILSECLGQIKRGYDERIFLEIALVRLARMESSITLQEVIDRLNKLAAGQPTGNVKSGGSLFDAVPPKASEQKKTVVTSETKPEPTEAEAPPPHTENDVNVPLEPSAPFNLPKVQMNWPAFLNTLKQRNQMLASMLSMGKITAVHDSTIVVSFGSSYKANKQVVEKAKGQETIESALTDFFKRRVRIEFELAPAQAQPAADRDSVLKKPKIDAQDLFLKDPALKKIVERLDGEIIGRRKIED